MGNRTKRGRSQQYVGYDRDRGICRSDSLEFDCAAGAICGRVDKCDRYRVDVQHFLQLCPVSRDHYRLSVGDHVLDVPKELRGQQRNEQ